MCRCVRKQFEDKVLMHLDMLYCGGLFAIHTISRHCSLRFVNTLTGQKSARYDPSSPGFCAQAVT